MRLLDSPNPHYPEIDIEALTLKPGSHDEISISISISVSISISISI
jgi:hypothetical protein